jgi:hypothetical protein
MKKIIYQLFKEDILQFLDHYKYINIIIKSFLLNLNNQLVLDKYLLLDHLSLDKDIHSLFYQLNRCNQFNLGITY